MERADQFKSGFRIHSTKPVVLKKGTPKGNPLLRSKEDLTLISRSPAASPPNPPSFGAVRSIFGFSLPPSLPPPFLPLLHSYRLQERDRGEGDGNPNGGSRPEQPPPLDVQQCHLPLRAPLRRVPFRGSSFSVPLRSRLPFGSWDAGSSLARPSFPLSTAMDLLLLLDRLLELVVPGAALSFFSIEQLQRGEPLFPQLEMSCILSYLSGVLCGFGSVAP